MTVASPKLQRRERAIEAARRRIRLLEIETHRVKATLARLEADYEDDVADTLARRLRRRRNLAYVDEVVEDDHSERFSDAQRPEPALASTGADEARPVDTLPFTSEPFRARRAVVRPKSRVRVEHPGDPPPSAPEPGLVAFSPASQPSMTVRTTPPAPRRRRKTTGPVLVSLSVHAAVLSLCMTLTFVTLTQQPIPLFASPSEPDDSIPAPVADVKIEPSKFEDDQLQNILAEKDKFNLSDNLLDQLSPASLGAGSRPQGDIGQLDKLPSDLGSLLSGAGKPSSGKQAGEPGNAIFFGARSKGDRFVFVIDNSSSMKGGKLDMARAELVRSIDSLTPKQSFYVIFVSDKTYPMFYPKPELDMIPATPANKRRLAEWLPNAILASGKNREMIKAMDIAASLQPHAVFLLWDGDMRYSDTVRLDVMTHLTSPSNNWKFVIHTLGMGITSADAEQNLTAIAAAHGGLYRRVEIPPALKK